MAAARHSAGRGSDGTDAASALDTVLQHSFGIKTCRFEECPTGITELGITGLGAQLAFHFYLDLTVYNRTYKLCPARAHERNSRRADSVQAF